MLRLLRKLSIAAAAALLTGVVPFAGAQAAQASGVGPGSVRVAVLMFTLPSAQTFAVTPDAVRDTYFGTGRSVATFYAAASRGALQISGNVFGPYAVDGDTSSCDVGTWSDEARQAAASAGVDLSGYGYFAFLFPRVDACGWAGLGAVGDNSSYINAPAAGDVGVYHAAHELGHNFGADHAHSLTCAVNGVAQSLADSSQCTSSEYGDPFSVMGSGIVRPPSAWELSRMGLLTGSDVQNADAGATATYGVAALGSSSQTPSLLLLRRAAGGYLAIDYRRAGGTFDTFAGTSDPGGVFVHLVRNDLDGASSLLDAHPQTSTMRDAYMTVGQHLDDPVDGISITVVAADVNGADVHIGPITVENVAAPTPTPTPTPSATPTPTPTSPAKPVVAPPPPPPAPTRLTATVDTAGRAHLAWTGPSGATSATRYRVTRAGRGIAVVAASSFADPTALNAATLYQLQTINASGTPSQAVAIVVRPPDRVAPTAVRQVTMTRKGPNQVQLSWSRSTDNVAVWRYRLSFTTGYTQWIRRNQIVYWNIASGTYTFTIYAVDKARNSSVGTRFTFSV